MIGDRLLRVAHHAFVLLVVLAATIALSAQIVVDPRYVEFAPSADHNTLASDGTPLVQRYSLSLFAAGSSVAFDTMDLGKPTPSSGVIRVDFLPLLHTTPTPGVVYEARVSAVGPGGSTASALSNQFSFQAACAPSLNSSGQSFGSGGGTGSVGVTAGTGCTWSAVSNATWITLTGATSGTGNGSVPYSVAANTATAVRTDTLTVAGQTYTVTQAAASCTFSIAPTSQSVAATGGTGSTAVTAPAGCAWTGVSNNTSWLTVTSGASGSGNGTVAFSASANPNTSSRTGTLTIAGQTFSVNQAATSCTFALVPTSQSMTAAGGTGSTTVTALAGCAWTAVSNTSWLTVTSGASGNGGGTVAFSAAANPNTTSRTGTLTIAGQTFTVNQAAASCTFSIAPTSQSVAATGGTGATSVTAPAGCAWTGVSNNTSWLTVTSGVSGSGNGTVAFSASANPNTSSRTGTLTIAGQTFSVNQAAASCTFAIAPTSQSVAATGGTGATSVTAPAGCAWTGVSNNTSWLTVTSGVSGSGNGTVAFSASANPNTSSRTGTLTIAGQTFSVNQAAASCTFSIAPTSQSVTAAGGTGSTSVTAPAGCAWTGVSNNTSWLTVTSGSSGSGNGTVAFSASANPNTSSRTGMLTIAGQTFSVNQAAAPCTYALVPASQSVAATGGPGSTTVTALAGCAWTSVSNDPSWLTVTSGASGNGGGTVAFSAAANPNTTLRTGTLTIAGQTFTVNQAAASCTFSIAPTSQSVVAGGGAGSTTVTAPAGCSWTGVSNTSWLTVTSGATGTGNGSVAFTAAANATASPRTGTLTIANQTFTVAQDPTGCSFSISPSTQSVPAAGGDASTTVTTQTGCSWTAVSGATWITVTAGATGSGNGSASFRVAPSPSTAQRLGTVSIAGRTFMITQAANTCSYTLTPASTTLTATGGTGSVSVATTDGCTWAASTTQPWITVSGTSTTSGTATYTVAPNTGSQRIGAVSIGTQIFTVIQNAPTTGCSYSLSPTSQSVTSSGGAGSTTVTTSAGCAWTGVSNNTSWLTVTSGASGSGNGTVAFSVAANTSAGSRSGTLTIGGLIFTVTQAAAGCTFALTPASRDIVAGAGTISTSVTAPTGCSWTAVSNNTSWLTVTSGATGTGNGTVSLSATANTATQPRTGTAIIAGQTFTVTQSASGCAFTISPSSQSVPAAGGSGSTTVTTTAGCNWTSVSNATWITVTSGASGSGSGSASFTIAPSPSTAQRTGTLSIAGRTYTITQAANTCSYVLAPASTSLSPTGGAGNITVTTAAGCTWAASTTQPWITVSGTSTASGTATYTVAPNTGSSRVGAISIGTQVFTVLQSGSTTAPARPASLSSPSGLRIVGGGGSK